MLRMSFKIACEIYQSPLKYTIYYQVPNKFDQSNSLSHQILPRSLRKEQMANDTRPHQSWENDLNVNYTVGIDLGTTNIVVATCLSPEEGDPPFMKPMVCVTLNYPATYQFNPRDFVDEEGAPKLVDSPQLPTLHVTEIKKFLGLSACDMRTVNQEGNYNYPLADACIVSQGVTASPTQIVAQMAQKIVEHFEGRDATIEAVCTVPAYFGESQRRATKEALKMAGIDVVALLNEPTAAAVAHASQIPPQKRVLVVDVGGGTTDVTALQKTEKELCVQATSGDPHLGGQELDRVIVDMILARRNIPTTSTKKRKQGLACPDDSTRKKLLQEARRCKENLSTCLQEVFQIKTYNGVEVEWSEILTKEELREALLPTCQQVSVHIQEVLRAASWKPEDVDILLLVGGSTRVPVLRELILNDLPKAQLLDNVNPDFAVAEGAALHMLRLDSERRESRPSEIARVKDILSQAIGVATVGDYFSVLIPANTPIPWRAKDYFQTASDFQRKVTLEIYQGTASTASSNQLVGIFEMAIEPRVKGEIRICVEFDLTEDGILDVTAIELGGGGNRRNVKINRKNNVGGVEESSQRDKYLTVDKDMKSDF